MEALIFGSFHRQGADSYIVNIVVYLCDALHLLRDFIQVHCIRLLVLKFTFLLNNFMSTTIISSNF